MFVFWILDWTKFSWIFMDFGTGPLATDMCTRVPTRARVCTRVDAHMWERTRVSALTCARVRVPAPAHAPELDQTGANTMTQLDHG